MWLEFELGLGLKDEVRVEAEISSDLGPGQEAPESSLLIQNFPGLWESNRPDSGGVDILTSPPLHSFTYYFIYPFNKKFIQMLEMHY